MTRQDDTDSPRPVADADSLVRVASTALFAVDCWAYGSVDEPTISKALAENRVVKITPTEDGKFEVLEMCDEHFGATLTAEQLAEWGRELIAISSANQNSEQTRNSADSSSINMIPVDPFATLPMEFRLTNESILKAQSPTNIKIEKMAMLREATARGLIVDHQQDPETFEEVFIVHSASIPKTN